MNHIIINGEYKSNLRIYKIWYAMLQRCYLKSCTGYKHYGGRGILVCKSWKNNFMLFYKWSIRNGYSHELTLDRKNNNGNYSPYNCRFITPKNQQLNKRNNYIIKYNGESKPISQWAAELNISRYKVKKLA